ncbi:MAG: hypothetical protein ACREK5_01155, partial [Gemmatimonadota bacterium]
MRRRSHHADHVHDDEHVDLDLEHRHVDLEHRYIDLEHRYFHEQQLDDDQHLARSGGLEIGPPDSRTHVRSRSFRCRGAHRRAAFIALLCLVATAPSLPAQTIRLELTLTVRRSPQSLQISSIIHNRGGDPAYEVEAELRGVDATPRPVIGELQPGDQAEIAWEVAPDRWRTALRQIAAVRVRYHDTAGTWASSVTVVGQEADATVEGLAWPDDSLIEVAWREPAGTGRATWWSPVEIELEDIGRWRSEDGTASIEGRLEPATDITGWETTAFLLVLPEDAAAPGKVVRVRIDAR